MVVVDSLNTIIQAILHVARGEADDISSSVTAQEVEQLLEAGIQNLKKDPILLRLSTETYLVGDLHGNINDLGRIFRDHGFAENERYLFLGDYVDRGNHGIEVILLLIALKLKYPQTIYLLRGNHETRTICQHYGFFDEVCNKYHMGLFQRFLDLFAELPIAAVVGDTYFCVHGGLSPKLSYLSEIERLQKPKDILCDTLIGDILWSDPRVNKHSDYQPNDRKIGFYYSLKAVKNFLKKNSLEGIVRAHETCEEGFEFPLDNHPCCVTIFSTTNYCGGINSGAVGFVTSNFEFEISLFTHDTKESSDEELDLSQYLEVGTPDRVVVEKLVVA